MNLENLNLEELNAYEALSIEGGDDLPIAHLTIHTLNVAHAIYDFGCGFFSQF